MFSFLFFPLIFQRQTFEEMRFQVFEAANTLGRSCLRGKVSQAGDLILIRTRVEAATEARFVGSRCTLCSCTHRRVTVTTTLFAPVANSFVHFACNSQLRSFESFFSTVLFNALTIKSGDSRTGEELALSILILLSPFSSRCCVDLAITRFFVTKIKKKFVSTKVT